MKSKLAKKNTGKHPGGRPSKFGSIDMRQIKFLYLAGWDDVQVAAFIDITPRTLENWKRRYKEFFQAIKGWKKEADERVERSLYTRATGYTVPEEQVFQHQGDIVRAQTVKHYAPDVTAQIFWLKNRQPDRWREKIDHEHTGDLILSYGHRKQKQN